MRKLAAAVIISAIGMFMMAALVDAQLPPIGNVEIFNPNTLLKGEYAFTGTTTCYTSLDGFTPGLTPISTRVHTESYSTRGIWIFNGDGTGKVQGHMVGFNFYPSGAGGAASADFDADLNYSVFLDLSNVNINLKSLKGKITSEGARKNQKFACNTISLTGILSSEDKTLTFTSGRPEIETLTYNPDDVSLKEPQPRICHRSFVLNPRAKPIKILPSPH